MDKHELRDLYVKETGNPFPDNVAMYANWLEEKFTSTNTGSPKFSEESKEFIGKLFRSQIDLPPDIAGAVNEHFWDLL